MTVNIDDDTALDMLVDRVRFWTDDDDVVELFAKYYESCIFNGLFEGSDFNVMSIVDNDYVNWTEYGTREDMMKQFEDFDEDHILAETDNLILYDAC